MASAHTPGELPQGELNPSLRQQVLVGAGWMTGLQLLSKVIEVGFIAVLARLLTPADFGVIAGATIFVQFTSMLVEIGIGATLVQLPSLSRDDIRVAGTLVFLNSIGYFAATQLLAPLAGWFLHIPEVTPVLRVLSLVFLMQAFGVVSENLLLRKILVKHVMLAQLFSRLIGTGLIGLALAWSGLGYWALVAATLAETGIKAAILCMVERPPLRPLLKGPIARKLLQRSSGFSASRLINFVALRADNAVVGRMMDAASLGLYSRAYNLMSVPADLYGRIAERVIFPALARVQDDAARLRSAYLRGVELTAVIGIPLSALLAILAPEVIALILGPKWTNVIVPFAVLSSASYFRLGAKISASLQRAKGAVASMIVNQIVYAGLVVGGCLATYRFGIATLAQAVAASVIVSFLLISVNACRLVGVSPRSFAVAHLPGLLLAGLVTAVAYPVTAIARLNAQEPFVVLAFAGAAVGSVGVALLLTRPRWLMGEMGAGMAATALFKVKQRRRKHA
ncbi:lipopolysaccharide biosynthesis protein [Novosphingobium sp. 9U]|uniref:lipopolysaccharide biosynthesis protein n=1 Tax=Novosphingobium sp. 9U TaxID=2653158 RepID=UPI0012F421F6|nr:lipopolysaccharide biosynthesis protein [Novosphingobium sp. 9U]VWX48200.1 Lipopolysaccharide biosynthesis protein [Novosphingobium sp. 9U]